MASEDFKQASQELFAENLVEVLEWSFDSKFNGVPSNHWCVELIDRYSSAHALIGHGITLSALSAKLSPRQEGWFSSAREEFNRRNYGHSSEHFGFSEAGPIAHGAPLAVPMNATSLRHGKEMMRRFAEAAQCPVGLENLAFAFGMDDVKRQGDFINDLISTVDGFLLLDLHNIYCQIENFGVDALQLLNSYPLERVREIHLSGGSWSPSESGNRVAVRRDTHDDAVPQEVFTLSTAALKLCPNVEFVIMERLGHTMYDVSQQVEFREDFETMREILDYLYV